MDDFWTKDENGSVVCQPRAGIAVYWNERDRITLRMTNYPDDDLIVDFTADEAEAVIAGLQNALSKIPSSNEQGE